MIRCFDFKVHFNERVLFEIDDITFEKGILHIIKGENGSGKSSFFRALVGWIPLTQGRVEIDGNWIYQPQQFHLFKPKVHDNFKDRNKALGLMGRLNICELMDVNVQKLSGGERQKIALIRSLCEDSDIYLLDEPTSYMDNQSKQVAYALIQSELLDKGKTVLLITHESLQEPFKSAKQYLLKDQSLSLTETWEQS